MALILVCAALVAIGAHFIYRTYTDKLKQYPGPFLARWTDLWRFIDTITGWHEAPSSLSLHRKYGDIVRVAPNVLSFNHPQALRDIYGADKHFVKSQFYWVTAATNKGVPNPSLFSSQDPKWHDDLRRAMHPAFSLSVLGPYEPAVNKTVATFVEQLEKRFVGKDGPDGIVDLARWMHWYSFDVIGELTWGSAFGSLKSASDVDGIIDHTHRFLTYGQAIGLSPWLDRLLLKNPVLLWLNRKGYFNRDPSPAVPWALQRQVARSRAIERGEHIVGSSGRVDLLDRFLQAKEKHADTVTDKGVLGMGLSMLFAGSESTAITLTALFYFILKTRRLYEKLRAEIDANLSTKGKSAPVPYQAALKLPYLGACIKETFRMHPAGRFTLDRVLPPTGAIIAGNQIPGGTIVGMNPWSIHRRVDIFGEDVDTYRPERWLDEDEKTELRTAEMNRTLLQFGHDKFNCLGRHISTLEMYKVVPSLLMAFDFELADPEKEWRFEDGIFVNISGVDIRINNRS